MNFTGKHQAYYISSSIEVRKAPEIRKVLTIDVELYRALDDLDIKVDEIINPYQYKFNVYLPDSSEAENEVKSEIMSTLSKIPEVRLVRKVGIATLEGSAAESTTNMYRTDDGFPYYYSIEVVINSSISR